MKQAVSDRFRISKTGEDPRFPWALDYPMGFDPVVAGDAFMTFDDAVTALVDAADAQCPVCLRGAVADTDFGWKCENCGSYDIAADCPEPVVIEEVAPVTNQRRTE